MSEESHFPPYVLIQVFARAHSHTHTHTPHTHKYTQGFSQVLAPGVEAITFPLWTVEISNGERERAGERERERARGRECVYVYVLATVVMVSFLSQTLIPCVTRSFTRIYLCMHVYMCVFAHARPAHTLTHTIQDGREYENGHPYSQIHHV
jgi:hypothetical protein